MSFEIVKLARLRRPVRNPGIGITALIIMSILLAGLAGCASPATATKPTVVIGYMDNGAEPELIAIAQGLFSKRMNANVQIKYFDSGPASLGAIASGALQIMSGIGSPPIVSAITRGVSLQVVWSQELYTSAEGLVVRSDAGIHSVKDLQGKTIALVLGSTSEFALDATLKKAGVNPSTVHKLNMSPPAMRTAWSNHSIDAAYVWDPVFDTISHENGKILSTDQNVQQEAPVYSLSLVNANWAKSNPNLVKGYIQAQNDAVTYYKQHPDEALQLIAKQDGISVNLAKTEMAGYKIFNAQDQLGAEGLGQGNSVSSSLVAQSLFLSAAFMHSIGTLNSIPAHLEQDVNPTYVEDVLKGK